MTSVDPLRGKQLMPHVLVAGLLHEKGRALLTAAPDVTVQFIDEISEKSYVPHVGKADALLIRTQPLTADTIARALSTAEPEIPVPDANAQAPERRSVDGTTLELLRSAGVPATLSIVAESTGRSATPIHTPAPNPSVRR